MALSEEWARTIAKYPERYGHLAGLYLELLKEATNAGLPLKRIQYYIFRYKTIDNPLPPVYDVSKLTSDDKVESNNTVRGVNQMEEE